MTKENVKLLWQVSDKLTLHHNYRGEQCARTEKCKEPRGVYYAKRVLESMLRPDVPYGKLEQRRYEDG